MKDDPSRASIAVQYEDLHPAFAVHQDGPRGEDGLDAAGLGDDLLPRLPRLLYEHCRGVLAVWAAARRSVLQWDVRPRCGDAGHLRLLVRMQQHIGVRSCLVRLPDCSWRRVDGEFECTRSVDQA